MRRWKSENTAKECQGPLEQRLDYLHGTMGPTHNINVWYVLQIYVYIYSVHTHIYVYVYIYVYMYLYVSICIYVYIYILNVYYIYIYVIYIYGYTACKGPLFRRPVKGRITSYNKQNR